MVDKGLAKLVNGNDSQDSLHKAVNELVQANAELAEVLIDHDNQALAFGVPTLPVQLQRQIGAQYFPRVHILVGIQGFYQWLDKNRAHYWSPPFANHKQKFHFFHWAMYPRDSNFVYCYSVGWTRSGRPPNFVPKTRHRFVPAPKTCSVRSCCKWCKRPRHNCRTTPSPRPCHPSSQCRRVFRSWSRPPI